MYKLIWADKLAIFWAGIFYLAVVMMYAASGIPLSIGPLFMMFLWVIAPVWAVLRMIDWLFGGPGARRRYAPPRARNWASDGVIGSGAGASAGGRRTALLRPKTGVGKF